MSLSNSHNFNNPQSGTNNTNLTLTDLQLAACKPIRAGGSSWRAFCPFHGSDHQRSMRLNLSNGHFNCFACGAWGYTETARERWKEQQPKLNRPPAKNGTGKAPAARPSPRVQAPPSYPPLRVLEPAITLPLKPGPAQDLPGLLQQYQVALPGSWGEEYLRRRKIPLELAQLYGIGYAGPGKWAHSARDWKYGRLVMPHTRPDGEIVNLYGRAVGSNEKVPKALRHDHLQGEKGYFNAGVLGPDFNRQNMDYLKSVRPDGQPEQNSEAVFVCEGPFDALSLLAGGQKRVVAIFGVNGWRWEWTRSARSLVFALDTDETGQKSWRELARQARLRGKSVAFLPPEAYGGCKDVNEAWVSGALESYFESVQVAVDEPEVNDTVLGASSPHQFPEQVVDILDPRPDLIEDSWLWEDLFRLCLGIPQGILYGSLHGLRCCGVRLHIGQNDLLELRPGAELDSGQFRELEQHYFGDNQPDLENLLDRLAFKSKSAVRTA
jgi:hypothetical protein